MNQSQSQYDYGYEDSPDSDVQSTMPMAYQMGGYRSLQLRRLIKGGETRCQ